MTSNLQYKRGQKTTAKQRLRIRNRKRRAVKNAAAVKDAFDASIPSIPLCDTGAFSITNADPEE